MEIPNDAPPSEYISEGKRARDFTKEAIPGESHSQWLRRNNQELLEMLRTGKINEETYIDRMTGKDVYLERLAMTDPLTGLENRRAFGNLIESRQLKYGGLDGYAASVAFIDLDNLKAANTFGAWAGDAYIVNFAQSMNEIAIELSRKLSTQNQRLELSVARLGGDEFGIYVDSKDPAVLQQITQELLARCGQKARDHQTLSTLGFDATASFGWRNMDNGSTPEDVIKEANIAQIAAKGRGKNTSVMFEELTPEQITKIMEESQEKHKPKGESTPDSA